MSRSAPLVATIAIGVFVGSTFTGNAAIAALCALPMLGLVGLGFRSTRTRPLTEQPWSARRTSTSAWEATHRRAGGGRMSRRLWPLLGGIAAVSLAGVLTMGFENNGTIPVLGLAVLLPLAIGLSFTRVGRGGTVAERTWSAPVAVAPSMRVDPRAVPTRRSVARALGRVECRELATSPWFGVGLGFCVLLFVVFGLLFSHENSETWDEFAQILPWMAHPLVGLTVLAGHRAATRADREGVAELLDTCPVEATTRTAGLLCAAVVPMATLTVFIPLVLVVSQLRSGHIHGPFGGDAIADTLGAIVLGAGGLALGVAIGRWVRFALAPLVAVVGIAFATSAINAIGGNDWNPFIGLSTAPTQEGLSPVYADRHPQWHLVWLVALVAIVGIVAVARSRRDRTVAVAATAAIVLGLVAGIGATRPLSAASAARIADRIAHPAAHQECTSAGPLVEVCAFPIHRHLLDLAVERVTPIARVLPAELSSLTIRQIYTDELADLPPEVRRLVDPSDIEPRADEVPLGFGGDSSRFLDDELARDLAFVSLGLPAGEPDDLLPTVVAGEARGVVALWLAARGLDADDARRLATAADPFSVDAFDRGATEIGPCSVPSVVWSQQDLAAARTLMTLPEARVATVVQDGWERWSDPATGTDELLAALGLPGVGPFDRVVPRPGEPC